MHNESRSLILQKMDFLVGYIVRNNQFCFRLFSFHIAGGSGGLYCYRNNQFFSRKLLAMEFTIVIKTGHSFEVIHRVNMHNKKNFC